MDIYLPLSLCHGRHVIRYGLNGLMATVDRQLPRRISKRTTKRKTRPSLRKLEKSIKSSSQLKEKFFRTFASKCPLDQRTGTGFSSSANNIILQRKTTFRAEDIKKHLRNLQPDKAACPNGIPARVLNDIAQRLQDHSVSCLSYIFHKVYFQVNGRLHSQ